MRCGAHECRRLCHGRKAHDPHATTCHHDVRRFDVAVDDSFRVTVPVPGESLANPNGPVDPEKSKLDGFRQRLISDALMQLKAVACAKAEAAAGGLLELDGEDSPNTALAQSVFGHCYARKGDAARAEPLLQTGYEKLNAISPPNDTKRITSLEYLARFYAESGRGSDAARLRAELDQVSH